MQSLMPKMSNYYTKNRATFSPDDDLVLSDGVLWDVRSNKAIHKFDKLNQVLSGVFHPSGLEVSINSLNILSVYLHTVNDFLTFNEVKRYVKHTANRCFCSKISYPSSAAMLNPMYEVRAPVRGIAA
jgi:hypothetical protein